jgi:hypothetical protein
MRSTTHDAPDTTVAARVPTDLARAFSAIAEREERSVSGELRRLMRQHVSLNASTPLGGGADETSGGQARHGSG